MPGKSATITPPEIYQQFPVLMELCRARTVSGDIVTYCDREAWGEGEVLCSWHQQMRKVTPDAAWDGWDVDLVKAAEYTRQCRQDRGSLT